MSDELNGSIGRYNLTLTLSDLSVMSSGRNEQDLTFNDILYLNLISGIPDCTASEIADTVHVARSSVTVKINDLCRKGYVVRTKSEKDGRVQYLSLSPKVSGPFVTEEKMLAETVAQLRDKYGETELKLFCEILDSLSDGLRAGLGRDRILPAV